MRVETSSSTVSVSKTAPNTCSTSQIKAQNMKPHTFKRLCLYALYISVCICLSVCLSVCMKVCVGGEGEGEGGGVKNLDQLRDSLSRGLKEGRFAAFNQRAEAGMHFDALLHTSVYVSIRQHAHAYASIRKHTQAYLLVSDDWQVRRHASAYVSIRKHTSGYVSIPPRQ
jgi:hypothetical protein